ncbi:MAG: hypothetical protein ACI92G_000541 [Candidatus Pelagisphaera sp.]
MTALSIVRIRFADTDRLTPNRFIEIEVFLIVEKPAVGLATPMSTLSTLTIPFIHELFQGYRKLTLSGVSISSF